MSNQYSVVLFDGVCNFCNSSVNFLIRHDQSKKLRFASLQSEIGQMYLLSISIDYDPDTLILIENNHFFIKTSAVLRRESLLRSNASRRRSTILKLI